MIKFSECSSLAWSYYKYIIIQEVDDKLFRLVSLVGKVPVYRAEGSSSIPIRTNTQGHKIIEEKVLPLL